MGWFVMLVYWSEPAVVVDCSSGRERVCWNSEDLKVLLLMRSMHSMRSMRLALGNYLVVQFVHLRSESHSEMHRVPVPFLPDALTTWSQLFFPISPGHSLA